jgi:hypothetical protein
MHRVSGSKRLNLLPARKIIDRLPILTVGNFKEAAMQHTLKICGKLISILAGACLLIAPDKCLSASTAFEYYGWFYAQYGLTSAPNDLAKVAPYSNTGFAIAPQQGALLKPYAFPHNFFLFNQSAILDIVYQNAGKSMPAPNQYGVVWHANYIPDFRNKFFAAYRQYMSDLKNTLTANGTYNTFDIFYLVDEPALHRNVFLDQAFLNQYVADFKTYFPGKKGAIPFAQDTSAGAANYARGLHYNPPSTLDVVIVEPYFTVSSPGQPTVACTTASIQNWLYQGNAESNVNWAKQFGKPVIVTGDGRLQGGLPLPDCYITTTYNVLKADAAIKGLVWWIYDKDYVEGQITGGGNSSHLVNLIASLGTSSGTCYNTSNYAHVTAGRAYNSVGYARANGSNQNMGLNNVYYMTKLRNTATNYYVIDGTCP